MAGRETFVYHSEWYIPSGAYFITIMTINNNVVPKCDGVSTSFSTQTFFQIVIFLLGQGWYKTLELLVDYDPRYHLLSPRYSLFC